MKTSLFIFLFLVLGCSNQNSGLHLVALQFVGKGTINEDPCKRLYLEDGSDVVTPTNFKLKPHEAVIIAKNNLDYLCTHKWGAQIYADNDNYYIVRLDVINDAIIINGTNGAIISKGFMRKSK